MFEKVSGMCKHQLNIKRAFHGIMLLTIISQVFVIRDIFSNTQWWNTKIFATIESVHVELNIHLRCPYIINSPDCFVVAPILVIEWGQVYPINSMLDLCPIFWKLLDLCIPTIHSLLNLCPIFWKLLHLCIPTIQVPIE